MGSNMSKRKRIGETEMKVNKNLKPVSIPIEPHNRHIEMTPYKDLGDIFDDLSLFGNDWVNENDQREIALHSELDSSCGE